MNNTSGDAPDRNANGFSSRAARLAKSSNEAWANWARVVRQTDLRTRVVNESYLLSTQTWMEQCCIEPTPILCCSIGASLTIGISLDVEVFLEVLDARCLENTSQSATCRAAWLREPTIAAISVRLFSCSLPWGFGVNAANLELMMLPRGSTLIHYQGQVKNHGQQAFHTVPVVGFEPLLGSMQLSKEKTFVSTCW